MSRHPDSLPRLLLVMAAIAWPGATAAQSSPAAPVLAPADDRISDEAIHRDHGTYQATQDRIQALNDAGRPLQDYHLAKAQCWLDVSFHEYSRNDRSDFPQDALDEAERLITAMEGDGALPDDTPLVNDARRLREDLWQRLGALRGTPGFRCAQHAVACGEVELVHAGNEFNQQHWRHAKPYIQIAEDQMGSAEAMARQCPDLVRKMDLTAVVLFDFDRADLEHARADSLDAMRDVLRRIRDEGMTVETIALTGHADRLHGRGEDHNRRLSERRAQAVREWLIQQGFPASMITYDYRGDAEQVQACDGSMDKVALHECLLPNRRVQARFVVMMRTP